MRVINLEKRNDEIGSVCKVTSENEDEIVIPDEDENISQGSQEEINNENEE